MEQTLERYSVNIVKVEEIMDINYNSEVVETVIKNIDLSYITKAKEHSLILILPQLRSHSY